MPIILGPTVVQLFQVSRIGFVVLIPSVCENIPKRNYVTRDHKFGNDVSETLSDFVGVPKVTHPRVSVQVDFT